MYPPLEFFRLGEISWTLKSGLYTISAYQLYVNSSFLINNWTDYFNHIHRKRVFKVNIQARGII